MRHLWVTLHGTSQVSRKGFSSGDLEATYVINKLEEISALAGAHPEEYIIAIVSIAEKPKIVSTSVYGDQVFGSVNPSAVLKSLAAEIAKSTKLKNLYTQRIDASTTVKDVLGHCIIKINANTTAEYYKNYTLPNALISEASMASEYIEAPIVAGRFNSIQNSPIYWGKESTNLTYYYHQAQLTEGNGASFTSRENAIVSIINQSKEIYEKSQHNGWFQIGLGGYTKSNSENRAAVAQRLNPFLLNKINEKLATDPSPVGIVLMNYCTDDATKGTNGKGLALVNAIIKMNGKFRLDRDPNAPEWYDNDTPTTVQSAKEGYSSGFNVDTENWKAF